MSRVERSVAILALALCFSCGSALAQQGEGSEGLRPTGPVTITADHAEWQKGGAMVYTGNVRLESGDLKLSGDRLHLTQAEDGEFEAKVDGRPAALDHAGLAAASGGDGKRVPVSARALQLTYDSREEIVVIDGDALLTRGGDEIRGQNIRYDVVQRRVEAQGKQGGQVQIVIQPPPRKDKSGSNGAGTPAPQP